MTPEELLTWMTVNNIGLVRYREPDNFYDDFVTTELSPEESLEILRKIN